MQGWTLAISTQNTVCTAFWVPMGASGPLRRCNASIDAGELYGTHVDYGGERLCIACIDDAVRGTDRGSTQRKWRGYVPSGRYARRVTV